MNVTGKAPLAGVMGWPVEHSRSPMLHRYWLKHYEIDGAYIPLPVPPESLKAALQTLPLLGFAGVNLTAPHKEAALTIVDEADLLSKRIGAVNTVTVQPDGTLKATNTDGFGFLENLQSGAPNWHANLGPAVVIGAGGAARAIVVALLDHGVGEVRVVNRTKKRAAALVSALGSSIKAHAWGSLADALADASLLINATTLGMNGKPSLELDLEKLPTQAVVTDIVYSPLETPLLRAARARGNLTVDGLGMLLHQARPGFRMWFGEREKGDDVDPQVTTELRAYVSKDLGR